MVKFNEIPMEEIMDIDKFKKLAKDLSKLPTPKEFKEKVEDELWQMIANTQHDVITFENLQKDLIGYIPDDEGKDSLPWWLNSFDWQIRVRAAERNHSINLDFIKNRLKGFSMNDEILKPSLPYFYGSGNQFLSTLEDLHTICGYLNTSLGLGKANERLIIPDRFFFVRTNEGIRTTDQFKKWFDEILKLCPPCQPQLTSLLILYSNVNANMAKQYMNDPIQKTLEKLIKGPRGDNKISGRDLFRHTRSIAKLMGVFDINIDYPKGYEGFNKLSPLEVFFYIGFADMLKGKAASEMRSIKKWVNKGIESIPRSLKDEEMRDFSAIRHSIPVYLEDYRRPTILFSGGRYAKSSRKSGFYDGSWERISEIKKILSSLDLLEEKQ